MLEVGWLGESFTGGVVAGRRLEAEELRRLWLRDPCDTLQSSGGSSCEGGFDREGGVGDLWLPPECPSSLNYSKIRLGQRVLIMSTRRETDCLEADEGGSCRSLAHFLELPSLVVYLSSLEYVAS